MYELFTSCLAFNICRIACQCAKRYKLYQDLVFLIPVSGIGSAIYPIFSAILHVVGFVNLSYHLLLILLWINSSHQGTCQLYLLIGNPLEYTFGYTFSVCLFLSIVSLIFH